MSGQEQASKGKTEQAETAEVEAKDMQNQDLSADVEDILADIDEVLEENAQEFVQNYVQKGGE